MESPCASNRPEASPQTIPARREFPQAPIVGVGAVILDQDGVLLIRRGHPPLAGEWSLPGGALELGESLAEGVMREVMEETGLRVHPVEIVEVFEHIAREEDGRVRFHYVVVDYRCRVLGGSLSCGTDALDATWRRRNDLHAGRPFLPARTLEVIEKAFRQLTAQESL
jgi:8-oxo-dGTP diphosphatase